MSRCESTIRYKLLKATEHNWGLACPGDWSTVTWQIYSDGSYSVRAVFIPLLEDLKCGKKSKSMKGQMDAKAFSELKKALNVKQWKDPNIKIDACDGVAWDIKQYASDGKLLNTSGKTGYIWS